MSDTTAVEKVARAICKKLGVDPDTWKGTQRLVGNPGVAAIAAIAAYEAHMAEAGMVSGPKNVLE